MVKIETLVLFVQKNNTLNTHTDVIVSGKRLRIIFFPENIKGIALISYKFRIRKLIKNCCFFATPFAAKFKGTKIRKSGYSLVIAHITSVLKMISPKNDIVIFSVNPDDINLLPDVLMSFKNISFVTTPTASEVFSEKLLCDFGITGATKCSADVSDKTVLIMPGGEIFPPEGASSVINLSKSETEYKNISPENISFRSPEEFDCVSHFIRRADVMETVLSFFDMDFSVPAPVSVNFNKQN